MPSLTTSTLLSVLLLALAPAAASASHVWTNASKQAVGTPFGSDSPPVWFTVGQGILNETYYPRIDRAQVGDQELLFVKRSVFLEEKRDFSFQVGTPTLSPRPRIRARERTDADDAIRFEKEIVVDPWDAVVRVRYRFLSLPPETQVFVLHKPTAGGDGAGDRARLQHSEGRTTFFGWDDTRPDDVQAVAVSVPVLRAGLGVVGESDGWQDLSRYRRLAHLDQQLGPENLAATLELAPSRESVRVVEIAIAFGRSIAESAAALERSRARSFASIAAEYDRGWDEYVSGLAARSSWIDRVPAPLQEEILWDAIVIRTHEDKLNPGAIVASLSIPDLPGGRGASDGRNTGGYHLVWPRDLFKAAQALLRMGDAAGALRALRFQLRMEAAGRMSQNTWVDGTPFWRGFQLDQEAFPLLLADRLRETGWDARRDEDLARFLARRLSVIEQSDGRTGQERWEEVGGFSPNTLAVAAAAALRVGREDLSNQMIRATLEKTVATSGPLSEAPYFLRIAQNGRPNAGEPLTIANGGPTLPEYRVVDGGFLEWVRWFPRLPEAFAAALRNSIRVLDNPANGVRLDAAGLSAPLYRRYTADAYGVSHEGGPWPILTLERSLVASRAGASRALELLRQVSGTERLCPEQLSLDGDRWSPMPHGARPLVWCHAERIEQAYRLYGDSSP